MHSDEQAIRDLVQTWLKATATGDLDQVLALMSDDVIFHTPAREPFGKQDFAAATRASEGKIRAEGTADVKEVQVSGDLAFCRTHLNITLRTPEGVEVKRLSGYTLSVLRRQGGRWALVRDANLVMPEPETRAIKTQLMFDGQAEEAMNFYVSLFHGTITHIERYGPGEPGKEGSIKWADFTLGSHRLACIDSPIKHAFTFTPSISFFIDFHDEAELDRAFSQLAEGGAVLMPLDSYGFSTRFAWVQDRFGVSWQLNFK